MLELYTHTFQQITFCVYFLETLMIHLHHLCRGGLFSKKVHHNHVFCSISLRRHGAETCYVADNSFSPKFEQLSEMLAITIYTNASTYYFQNDRNYDLASLYLRLLAPISIITIIIIPAGGQEDDCDSSDG